MRAESFTWEEMREYWGAHSTERARVDFASDPDGLANVLYVNAPLWYNEHHARSQRVVFDELIQPPSRVHARALDVGCGTGRWSRTLAARGYQVTGVDLQSELIDRNRDLMPDIDFHNCTVQELPVEAQFDLVCSVTVMQHVPYGEQEKVAAHLGALLAGGGNLVILENVRDRGRHVFARSEQGWTDLFGEHGFELQRVKRYDYNPASTLLGRALTTGKAAVAALERNRGSEHAVPRSSAAADPPTLDSAFRHRMRFGVRRAALVVDRVAEPMMIDRDAHFPSGHAGFLFARR